MKRVRAKIFLLLILALVSVPDIAYSVGEFRLRIIDIVIILIGVLSLSFGFRFEFSNLDILLLSPLFGILFYSALLSPVQHFPLANSISDVLELFEIILLYFSSRNILNILEISFIWDLVHKIAIWTTASSFIGVVAFALTGTRLVYLPYVFGLPLLSMFYLVSAYFRTSEIKYSLFSIVILVRVLFTQSRSIWLAMLGAVILLLLVDGSLSYDKVQKELLSLLGTSSVVIVGTLAIFPSLTSRFLSLIRGNQFLFARPVIYLSAFQTFTQHPFGIGLGNFTLVITRAANEGVLAYPNWFRDIAGRWIIEYSLDALAAGRWGAHSDFVKFTTELGIIGGILITLFWMLVLKLIISSNPTKLNQPFRYVLVYFAIQSVINSYLLNGGNGAVILFLLSVLVTIYEES